MVRDTSSQTLNLLLTLWEKNPIIEPFQIFEIGMVEISALPWSAQAFPFICDFQK